MTRRTWAIFSAVGALLLGAQALAQDIAPPDIKNEASVRQWALATKISDVTQNPTAAWNLIAAVDEGLLSYTVLATPNQAKMARVAIRLERFQPRGGFRSDATVYDVDCAGDRFRKVQDSSFAEHNFGGRRTERPMTTAWAPTAGNALVSAVKSDTCLAPPVDITNERAMRQWMNVNNIRDRAVNGQIDWTLLGGTPDGLLFTQRGDFTVESRRMDLSLRRDFWRPVVHPQLGAMRSELLEYEVNCTSRQIRQIASTQYAGWNLEGRSNGVRKIEDWFPLEQHPYLGSSLTATCLDFRVQREFKLRPPAYFNQ